MMTQSPDIPQTGQPYAAPRIRLHVDQSGRKLPAFVFPYQVVKVKSRDDLGLALDHYGHLPTMKNANTGKSPEALRYLLEWVFPALRWFCRVYQQPIPAWLSGNGWAEGLSPEEFERFFGGKPLQVLEWHEDKRRIGKRA